MTTDHEGKLISVKVIRSEKLPSMMPQPLKPAVSQKKDVAIRDEVKQ